MPAVKLCDLFLDHSENHEFVAAKLATGCRPSEVARVTAADVNLELGDWLMARHKTLKKTGRPRVVYLTPEIADLTCRLVTASTERPLFCDPRGNSPSTGNDIRSRLRRLRAKVPHLDHFVQLHPVAHDRDQAARHRGRRRPVGRIARG